MSARSRRGCTVFGRVDIGVLGIGADCLPRFLASFVNPPEKHVAQHAASAFFSPVRSGQRSIIAALTESIVTIFVALAKAPA